LLALVVEAYKSWKVSGKGGREDSFSEVEIRFRFVPLLGIFSDSELSLSEYSTRGIVVVIAKHGTMYRTFVYLSPDSRSSGQQLLARA